MIKKDKISLAIIGPYPPPIGGVSVHIKRLKEQFDKMDMNLTVFDLSGGKNKGDGIKSVHSKIILIIKLLFSNYKIIHHHAKNWKLMALSLVLKVAKKKLVATFHSFREDPKEMSFIDRICMLLTLRWFDYFVVVAPHINDILVAYGVKSTKISVVPAFIPPIVQESDFKKISNNILHFMKEHSPILTANAYKISFFQGNDLYGIDMCIRLTNELKAEFPNIGFVFCLPTIGDYKYYRKLIDQIFDLKLQGHFLFVTEQKEYYPIIARSDLLIRPTNTDGDALSIREALALRKQTLCSDVVTRPDGVILFQSRNFADLHKKTRQILHNMEFTNDFELPKSLALKDAFPVVEQVRAIYLKILNNEQYAIK